MSEGHASMQFSTNGTVNLSAKECLTTVVGVIGVTFAASWAFFGYTDGKFADLIERQDALHRESRDYTEKVIEDKIAGLDAHLGGIGTAINNIHETLREQATVVIHQVRETATTKAELTNVKEQLKEESLEKEELKDEVSALQDTVEDIAVALREEDTLSPLSVEPAANRPSTHIKPAFKPRR